jgi:hypothetical protein
MIPVGAEASGCSPPSWGHLARESVQARAGGTLEVLLALRLDLHRHRRVTVHDALHARHERSVKEVVLDIAVPPLGVNVTFSFSASLRLV